MSTRLLEISAALVLLSPFVPMLFHGEEWGASSPFLYFTDHSDPMLGDAVREGRRNEFASFGWDPERIPDPQDPGSFVRSKLDWSEIDRPPHAELLSWHRRLIALRSSESGPAGLVPRHVEVDEGARCMVVVSDRLTWAANFSSAPQRIASSASIADLILTNGATTSVDQGQICMPPQSVAVFRSS